MLIKLLKEQISDFWEEINFSIQQSLPPTTTYTEEDSKTMLEKCLTGEMEVWAMYSQEEEPRELLAIGTTCLQEDFGTGVRSLLIYSFFSLKTEVIPDREYELGFVTLSRYAKFLGCKFITAFTLNSRIRQLAKATGRATEQTYITMEV